ncbi:hypothetical protein FVER53590_30350 [Fusarium verticillioides]|nr:hypothetical protein FVER53590_30350 [Fusarium verticillioides]
MPGLKLAGDQQPLLVHLPDRIFRTYRIPSITASSFTFTFTSGADPIPSKSRLGEKKSCPLKKTANLIVQSILQHSVHSWTQSLFEFADKTASRSSPEYPFFDIEHALAFVTRPDQ